MQSVPAETSTEWECISITEFAKISAENVKQMPADSVHTHMHDF